jgi:hypothetical protein
VKFQHVELEELKCIMIELKELERAEFEEFEFGSTTDS